MTFWSFQRYSYVIVDLRSINYRCNVFCNCLNSAIENSNNDSKGKYIYVNKYLMQAKWKDRWVGFDKISTSTNFNPFSLYKNYWLKWFFKFELVCCDIWCLKRDKLQVLVIPFLMQIISLLKKFYSKNVFCSILEMKNVKCTNRLNRGNLLD